MTSRLICRFSKVCGGLIVFTLCALTSRAQVIFPIGDSITYGFLSISDPSSAGYRYQLLQDLGGASSGYTFVGTQSDNGATGQPMLPSGFTANEGHNGYTIEGIDAELTANNNNQPGRSGDNNGGHWIDGGNGTGRSAINPTIVLLNAGTNDATDGENAATMLAQMTQLLTDLNTDLPYAQIFVGNITPRIDNSSMEVVEEQYNAGLPAVVAAKGANFHLVDLHDAVSVSNINPNDGVGGQHPNLAGYQQMGDAWYNALVTADAAPEPSTYALMSMGFLALLVVSRRRFHV